VRAGEEVRIAGTLYRVMQRSADEGALRLVPVARTAAPVSPDLPPEPPERTRRLFKGDGVCVRRRY
jgi:hypothetical protein